MPTESRVRAAPAEVRALAARRAPRVVPPRNLDAYRPALAGADRSVGSITLPAIGGLQYAYEPARGALVVDGVVQESRRGR